MRWERRSEGIYECVVGFGCRGTSVLVFFGEKTDLVVVCGGCTVSSGEGHLIGCVGRIDGMCLWLGITRGVWGSLVGLVEVGPSV